MMDFSFSATAMATVLVIVVLAWFRDVWNGRKLPPGPVPLPIIRNVLQILGKNPHQTLAKLSKAYGPLMCLRLGSLCTVVASSPEAAKQVLRVHDKVLSNRTILSTNEAHQYHENGIVFLPPGSRWQRTRKICKEYFLSNHRLDESQGLRQEKVTKMREFIRECSVAGRSVNLGEAAFTTVLNLMTSALFSVDDFCSYDTHVSHDFRENVEGFVQTLDVPNLSDFFPLLKSFDLQGLKARSEFYLGKVIRTIEGIVRSRLQESNSNKNDMLNQLVNLMEDKEYNLSINDIVFILMDLFLGATHTTSNTVEMAMKELLLNPAKMSKATNELRTVMGKKKPVQESDAVSSRFPYLHAVIKETLRLHPVIPLLTARKADDQVEINGHTIPKNAMIFVNVWAIGRDPNVWPNPTSFEPERFLNNNITYNGQHFSLTPFGSGRRICIGMGLIERLLPFMVASFIHEFDWKLQPGVKLDHTATTTHHHAPLIAIPIYT